MEALPEALLVRVLAFVDLKTLLSSIPLVCRSWNRLSTDRLLWELVDVEFVQHKKKTHKLFAAALRRAPTLRTVDLSDNYSGLTEDSAVWRALRDGVTDVRGLVGLRERTTDKNYVVKLVAKYGPHLRRLRLTLGPSASDYVAKLDSGATVRVFDLISQTPHLRRLVISDESLRLDMYNREFRRGLSQLRHVAFCGFPEQPWTADQENIMILDILRNRKEALQTVDLVWTNHGEEVNSMMPQGMGCTCHPMGHNVRVPVRALPDGMLRAINDCRELESLRVMYYSVAAIRGLRRLRRLVLVFGMHVKEGKMRGLEKFMRGCDTMAQLEEVRLEYTCALLGDKKARDAIKKLVKTIEPVVRSVCPKLKSFAMNEFNSLDSIVMS